MARKKKHHSDRCCNPFKLPGEKGHKGKGLLNVTKSIRIKFPDLPKSSKICKICYIKVNAQHEICTTSKSVDLDTHAVESCMDIEESSSVVHDNINTSLNISSENTSSDPSQREKELENMLTGLKNKFSTLNMNDPLRLQILTIAPTEWSVRKLASEFHCSRRMAENAKKLQSSKGVLPHTTAKAGKKLPQDVVNKVENFYNNDFNSRQMSGIKDVISVKYNGERTLMQKRLLMSDLKSLHTKYKEDNPDHKVSFTKFCQLRPRYCILAGASGSHTVCVCTIHQNCKLMLEAIRDFTETSDVPIVTYQDCLQLMTCGSPSVSCSLGECENCSSTSHLSLKLLECLQNNFIDNVLFSSWTGTDRSTLQNTICSSEDFVKILCDKLVMLKPHSYIAKKQSQYFDECKNNLESGEILVTVDFAENYKYVVQDASQAFHFNNDQCTVFPVVCYYKDKSEIKHKSFIFLSDSTKHDAAAVYTAQTILIPKLKQQMNACKIIYFSDGAKQHFKNRSQMINLVKHARDFGIKADWHFHATAHGKSSCDGIGATFKRQAAYASLLAKPTEAILTAKSLYDWGKAYFKSMDIMYYSKTDHNKMQRKLNKRFSVAPPVPEIQKSHSFTVLPNNVLFVKRFSTATHGLTLSYNELE